jgi:hypothetical protein
MGLLKVLDCTTQDLVWVRHQHTVFEVHINSDVSALSSLRPIFCPQLLPSAQSVADGRRGCSVQRVMATP